MQDSEPGVSLRPAGRDWPSPGCRRLCTQSDGPEPPCQRRARSTPPLLPVTTSPVGGELGAGGRGQAVVGGQGAASCQHLSTCAMGWVLGAVSQAGKAVSLPNLPNPLVNPTPPPTPDPGHTGSPLWVGLEGLLGTAHSWEGAAGPGLCPATSSSRPGACALPAAPAQPPSLPPSVDTHGSEDTEPEPGRRPGAPGGLGRGALSRCGADVVAGGQGPCPGVTCGSGHLPGRGQTLQGAFLHSRPAPPSWPNGGGRGVCRCEEGMSSGSLEVCKADGCNSLPIISNLHPQTPPRLNGWRVGRGPWARWGRGWLPVHLRAAQSTPLITAFPLPTPSHPQWKASACPLCPLTHPTCTDPTLQANPQRPLLFFSAAAAPSTAT